MKFSHYFCGLLLFRSSTQGWLENNTGFMFIFDCGLFSRTGFPSALNYKLERHKLRKKIRPKWI